MNIFHTSNVAVLIAVYNGEKYLAEQLDSLLAQTYTDWIAYIHDDGSSDRTPMILEQYAHRYPERFILLDGEATGSAKDNFFYLFGSVEAPLYMCCDQDDVWLADKIEKTLREMRLAERETDIPCLVYTDLKIVDESLHVISGSMDQYQKLNCRDARINHVLVQNVVTGCTMMINRQLRDMILSLKDREKIVMHDWWAALIAAQFGVLHYLDEATILYRQHDENDTGAKKIDLAWYIRKILFHRRDMKHSLEMMRKQAEALTDTFQVEPDSAAAAYAVIHKCPKLKRMKIYRKYKITSKPLAKQFAILLFG